MPDKSILIIRVFRIVNKNNKTHLRRSNFMKKLLSLLALSALLCGGSSLFGFVEVDIVGAEGACCAPTCNKQKLEIVCPPCPKTEVIPAEFCPGKFVPEQVNVTPAQLIPAQLIPAELVPEKVEVIPAYFEQATFTPEQVTTACPPKRQPARECAQKAQVVEKKCGPCRKNKKRKCNDRGCSRGGRARTEQRGAARGEYDYVEYM
jgi:hypothetical protein